VVNVVTSQYDHKQYAWHVVAWLESKGGLWLDYYGAKYRYAILFGECEGAIVDLVTERPETIGDGE
jgi:hypothetical protein